MDYIKLSYGDIDIYRTSLPLNVDKQPLLEEIYVQKRYIFFDKEYNDKEVGLPGLQLTVDIMAGDAVNSLKQLGYKIGKSIFESISGKEVYSGMQSNWIYISAPSNPNSNYHDHIRFSAKEHGVYTDYTWIYYIQMPDNCKDKEGHIFFKPNMYTSEGDEGAVSFFPEEGYLYFWNSVYAHRPELSPNSTKDRVILAGNLAFNTTIK